MTLEAIPDDKATLLTLLLPAINLVGITEQDFDTLGITTTERSSIAGPSLLNGVAQTYREMKVEGKVQFVETWQGLSSLFRVCSIIVVVDQEYRA